MLILRVSKFKKRGNKPPLLFDLKQYKAYWSTSIKQWCAHCPFLLMCEYQIWCGQLISAFMGFEILLWVIQGVCNLLPCRWEMTICTCTCLGLFRCFQEADGNTQWTSNYLFNDLSPTRPLSSMRAEIMSILINSMFTEISPRQIFVQLIVD